MDTKCCSGCKATKDFTQFATNPCGRHGLHSRCRACQRSATKRYYRANIEACKAKIRAYQADPANQPAIRSNRIKWLAKPTNRIAKNLRTQMWNALNHSTKSARTEKLIGISFEKFKVYLERQFLPGMSWDDRESFHIDHYIPCTYFDLSKPDEQALCFHYLNLRAVSPTVNLSKGSSLPVDYALHLNTLKQFIEMDREAVQKG